MTPGVLAMLVGIFGVPALLLWAAHRLRRRSPRFRAAFRGALAGHLLALAVGPIAAMVPPEAWTGDEVVRGALGLWSWVLLPLLGLAVGLAQHRRVHARTRERVERRR